MNDDLSDDRKTTAFAMSSTSWKGRKRWEVLRNTSSALSSDSAP
jgi:hypothetical protein